MKLIQKFSNKKFQERLKFLEEKISNKSWKNYLNFINCLPDVESNIEDLFAFVVECGRLEIEWFFPNSKKQTGMIYAIGFQEDRYQTYCSKNDEICHFKLGEEQEMFKKLNLN